MANSANYFGFVPTRHLAGGTIRPSERRILETYGTAIYNGDPVKLASDGTIQLADAGDRILGIFAGCYYPATDGTPTFSPYWPAPGGTLGDVDVKALVYDDPNIIYRVRSGGTPARTNIGNLADHVAGTGSAVTGKSGAYLSGTMSNAVASFRILDFVTTPENEVGQYMMLEVQLVESELVYHGQSTVGV